MENKRGKLIVIDGIDGSGKATQTKLLVEKLRAEGYNVETLDFPQYYKNFFGSLIGRFLKGEFGSPTEVNPHIASVLYAADRWESKEQIEGWLNEGKIVILDRYVTANMGHQGGKIKDLKEREDFLKWLEKMEFDTFKIPTPDLNIFLHLKPEVAQLLIDKKNTRAYTQGSKRDAVESDIEYLKNSVSSFLSISRANPETWKTIFCTNKEEDNIVSIEEIQNKILGIVKAFLIGKSFCNPPEQETLV